MITVIKNILAEEGYEVIDSNKEDGIFKIKDLDCGIKITCVLENNILYFSVPCKSIKDNALTPELSKLLLNAENGISTSAFKIYKQADESWTISLNNFCKLLDMGHEDKDDILSCVNFLTIDAFEANNLLEKY